MVVRRDQGPNLGNYNDSADRAIEELLSDIDSKCREPERTRFTFGLHPHLYPGHQMGVQAEYVVPDALRDYIRADTKRWQRIVREEKIVLK